MDKYKTPISLGYLKKQLTAALDACITDPVATHRILKDMQEKVKAVSADNGEGDITYRLVTQLEESNRCLLSFQRTQLNEVNKVLLNNAKTLTEYYGDVQ